jgi:hypothetical protein
MKGVFVAITLLLTPFGAVAAGAASTNAPPTPAPPAALATPAGPPSAPTPLVKGGFHLGAFNGGFFPKYADSFEAWLGRKNDYNVAFLADTAFSDYTKPNGTKVTDALSHSGWLTAVWVAGKRPDRNMLFSIPLATHQDDSLAHVAAGKWDDAYKSAAKTIAGPYPNAIIRIGWEFNSGWYSWHANKRQADYIAAFRHVAQIFKAASPNFTIDWCFSHGFSGQFDPSLAYPGDDVVDVIGQDAYADKRWQKFATDPKAHWNWFRDFQYGLTWQADFAAKHNKPMSFPEWGVNWDNPYFIEQMYDWIKSHNFAYASYWNSNSAFKGQLSNNQFPQASAEYKKLFATFPPKPL